ncbi:hypothetical protein cand_003300 [Cryptosporidium andersoni]|uniref:Uncharacterized protein n=1 Tax=Cryptosporidium andersoni TaxID=117008 RepID=A0A1J4MGZ0_9CRYT|nr:hypothetical protein cand_003300 [Cryptosporidium andersoni]
MNSSEDPLDWLSIDNLDDITSEFTCESNLANYDDYLDITVWNLCIKFKSTTLQNPATITFILRNWFNIIRGTKNSSGRPPKTSPPIPCKRSTNIFKEPLEISSKFSCNWHTLSNRLQLEPLKIEVWKSNTFGDLEIHSYGDITLKHILIQPDDTQFINESILSHKTWPTRILLYPYTVDNSNSTIQQENILPIGFIDIELKLQGNKKQNITEIKVQNRKDKKHILKKSKTESPQILKDKNINKSSDLSIGLYSDISDNHEFSSKKKEVSTFLQDLQEKDHFETINKTLNDELYLNFGYFKVEEFNIKPELTLQVLDDILDSKRVTEDDIRNTQEYEVALSVEIWKKLEKERFIKHIEDIEKNIRLSLIKRQEIIMKKFIQDIKRRNQKLATLENLLNEKIYHLREKEKSIEYIEENKNGELDNMKMNFQQRLDIIQSKFKTKLDIEKRKYKQLEMENSKLISKLNVEEDKSGILKKTTEKAYMAKDYSYFKSELSKKDYEIQNKDMEIKHLKQCVELLKASRQYLKDKLDQIVVTLELESVNKVPNAMDMQIPTDVDILIRSGLYNEDDQLIKLLNDNPK